MRVLLISAASVAVLVFGGCGEATPDSTPVGSDPSESTTPSTPSTHPSSEQADLIVAHRQRADVDGDGRSDQVRVLLDSPTTDEPGDGSVEVSLAAGGTTTAAVPFGYPTSLQPALDLNGDGHEQVLLNFTPGGDSGSLLVYTWHEGRIVQAKYDGDVPLGIEQGGDGLVLYHYVDDGVLYSWLRTDPVADGPVWNVEQWSWSVDGDRLVAVPAGHACVDVTSEETPQPC